MDKEFDWKKKWDAAIKKVDGVKPKETPEPSSLSKYRSYFVIKFKKNLENGDTETKTVATNLTLSDAEQFVRTAKTKYIMIDGEMIFTQWYKYYNTHETNNNK